ncbi:MAG: hypothetical protein ACJ72Z_13510 [Pyrinomonadaceae bacterium]
MAENAPKNAGRNANAVPQSYTNNNGAVNSEAEILANANVDTAANRLRNRVEEMRAAAANNVTTKPVPTNARPAAEDSTITTQLTDVARETRVWKKHPLLAKVEKIYDGKGASIKVYLKDGRVIDLPGTAIAQLDQVASATVLTLAGVTPPNTQARSKQNKSEK